MGTAELLWTEWNICVSAIGCNSWIKVLKWQTKRNKNVHAMAVYSENSAIWNNSAVTPNAPFL